MAHITKLSTKLNPPLGHGPRLQRSIVVGRKIKIVRLRVIKACISRIAESWQQKAGFSFLFDWKSQIRRRQNRDIFKKKHTIFGDAFIGRVVQIKFFRLDIPRWLGTRTATVGHIGQAHLIAVKDIRPGTDPRTAVIHPKIRLIDARSPVLGVVDDAGTGNDVTVPDQARVDLGVHHTRALVVINDIGFEDGILTPNGRFTPQFGVAQPIALHLGAFQESRHLFVWYRAALK